MANNLGELLYFRETIAFALFLFSYVGQPQDSPFTFTLFLYYFGRVQPSRILWIYGHLNTRHLSADFTIFLSTISHSWSLNQLSRVYGYPSPFFCWWFKGLYPRLDWDLFSPPELWTQSWGDKFHNWKLCCFPWKMRSRDA